MTNNILITLNINGYNHKLTNLTYADRLTQIIGILRNTNYNNSNQLPSIIGLQEVILGYEEKYYSLIQKLMPEYKIIKPYGYEAENYNSTINLLLVRKDILIRYVSKQLTSQENGGYLYNYVNLNTSFGKYLVFNLHLPQLSVFEGRTKEYIVWRKEIRKELFKAVCRKIAQYPDAKIIILGDMNCLENAEEISKLKALDMINITERNKPTYFNKNYGNKAVDYIFVSANMLAADSNIKISTALIDNSISKTYALTDHALLKTLISVDEKQIS